MAITENTWNTSLYDKKHDFVFKYGEYLVQMLTPQEGERILDIGCGTGYLYQPDSRFRRICNRHG